MISKTSSTIDDGIPSSVSGYPIARADVDKGQLVTFMAIVYVNPPTRRSSCSVDLMAGRVYSEIRFAVAGAT